MKPWRRIAGSLTEREPWMPDERIVPLLKAAGPLSLSAIAYFLRDLEPELLKRDVRQLVAVKVVRAVPLGRIGPNGCACDQPRVVLYALAGQLEE